MSRMKNKGSREGSKSCCDYAAALCPASSFALSLQNKWARGGCISSAEQSPGTPTATALSPGHHQRNLSSCRLWWAVIAWLTCIRSTMLLMPRSCLCCKWLRKLSSESIFLCSVFLWFGFIIMGDERQPLRILLLGNLKAVFILGMVKRRNEMYIGNGEICQLSVN